MSRHAAPRRPRHRHRWSAGLVAVALLGAAAVPALGFWTSSGTATGTARAGTVSPPTAVTATTTTGSDEVTVTWAAATPPSGATLDGYYVTRYAGSTPTDACDSDPDDLLPVTPLTCTDSGVDVGTYTYRVTAVLSDWTGTSAASASVTVTPDLNAPGMTLAGVNLTNAYLGPNGTNYRLYFRSAVAGSFQLAATVTDAGSGPASAAFPAVTTTGWTHPNQTVTSGTGSAPTITYTSSTYTWAASAGTPGNSAIVGRDLDGNTVTRTVNFRADNAAPTGGALNVNGTNSSTAGSTSNSTTGSWSITSLTYYTETMATTRSGLASSTLERASAPFTNGTCGTFGSPVTITGTVPIAQSGANGCYRYTLSGVDNVGNVVTRATTVRVDTTAPIGGALTVNGTAATAGGSTSSSTTGSWTISRTDFTDAESGITSSTLVRTQATLSNGVCGTFGTPTTIAGAPAQTLTARMCYRYVLTGTNAVGLTASLTTTVVVGPYVSGLALVNGTGTAGRVGQGDQVVITFSDPITPSTMCSSWTGTGDKVLNGDNQVTVTLTNAGNNDTVSVTATGCTFNFGTVATGGNYTTATATFLGAGANRSTVSWTAATRTLTVTLGATASGSLQTVASSTAVYTPSTAVQNTSGVALGGTFSTGALQQF